MHFFPRVSLLIGACIATLSASAAAEEMYVGTYTHFLGSRGIYHYHFDPATGVVSPGELAGKTVSPSFLAFRPGGRFLYAVNESQKGMVSAFSIGADGRLTLINQQPSGGAGPCHVFIDHSGRNALVANYDSGSVEVIPIRKDGSLGAPTAFQRFEGSSINPERQADPHAHSMYVDLSGRIAYACDLGTDRVRGFRFDSAKGTLVPDSEAGGRVAPGSGPRHLAFHPSGSFVYVINEMGETITAFSRNPSNGALRAFQVASALPANFRFHSTAAEIVMHPSGKFLYGSNRGHDSIASFSVAPNGKLTPMGFTPTGGKTPRSIAIDPSGKWLLAANQDSASLFVFRINAKTGRLTPTGQKVTIPSPVCVIFR